MTKNELIESMKEWDIKYNYPCSFMTDEHNKNCQYSVKHKITPLCSESGEFEFFGATIEEAIRNGINELDLQPDNEIIIQDLDGEFPAGDYYIGDLCYILKDEFDDLYDIIVVSGVYDQEQVLIKNHNILLSFSNTSYGDGEYLDNRKRKYSVDAGIIGICSLENEELRNIAKDECSNNNAHIIHFDKPFTVCYYDGLFIFDNIEIDTNI